MKATIDVPDNLLKEAERKATLRGVTLEQFIADALAKELTRYASTTPAYRVKSPLVPAKGIQKISITNKQIEDLLFE
jgi:hypothetical protein